MEDVERGRQREQDELYRDDHEGGRRPDVPMGDRVQDDVRHSHFSLDAFRNELTSFSISSHLEPPVPRRARRLATSASRVYVRLKSNA